MRLKIGSLTFDNHLIQGPLAGYSCAPFRVIAHRYGKPAYSCTEMISAKHLTASAQSRKRYLWKDPEEGFCCYQISGNSPDEVQQATSIVADAGADVIDLNCGCPVPKMRKKGVGSALLAKPELLYQCVQAMRAATALPITVKIRVDAASGDQYNQDVVTAIESAGANAIIVHGRHHTHGYETPCSHREIARVVEMVSIPVIGNGDVEDLSSLETMLQETGCSGVMVSRASVGQPWLFRQLLDPTYKAPTRQKIGQILMEHVQGLVDLEGEKIGILQTRKLGKYYARALDDRTKFVEVLQSIHTLKELQTLVQNDFG